MLICSFGFASAGKIIMTFAVSASLQLVTRLITLELIGRCIIDIHDLLEGYMIMCVYS